jgi:histidine decarboxylase
VSVAAAHTAPFDNPAVATLDLDELDVAQLPVPQSWQDELACLYGDINEKSGRLLGYPESQRFTSHPLATQFGSLALNNLGEPYEDGGPMRYATNSAAIERRVLEWFAGVYCLPVAESWGYLTGSGSEGNLQGLFLGREACGGVAARPVLYLSDAAHYSVGKAAFVLGVQECVVESHPSGEMDYDALATAMAAHSGRPALILATAGTTITEGIDDPAAIAEVCTRLGVPSWYIHLDAALCGLTLPFHPDPTAPQISFAQTPIDSVSVSIHKFLGAPFPIGVALARRHHVERIRHPVEYVNSGTGTLFGSRNGQAPLQVWTSLMAAPPEVMRRLVGQSVAKARYLESRLLALGVPAWRNPYAITVVFPTPSREVVERYSLATKGDCAHVITVPSATVATLDAFLADVAREVRAPSAREMSLARLAMLGGRM